MDNNHYLNDITEIKNIMNRSSRFLSLSGLSGVMAGIYALIGAWFAYRTIYFDHSQLGSYKTLVVSEAALIRLLIIAALVVVLSLVTGIVFSVRKAKKAGENVWDASSRRLIINLLIPLGTGGIFILFLLEKGILGIVAPLTLIFYGLACVNASKYTIGGVRYLGITMIILGLASTYFIGYGLLFWTLGFGVCHIVYGGLMYLRHERK
jgi:hypothetical protein